MSKHTLTVKNTPELDARLDGLAELLDTQNRTILVCLAVLELEKDARRAAKTGGKGAVLARFEKSLAEVFREPGRKWSRAPGPRAKKKPRGRLPPPCPVITAPMGQS